MLSVEPRPERPAAGSHGSHGTGAPRPRRAPSRPRAQARRVIEPRQRLRARPGLVLSVIGAGVLGVIALWWSDTPSVHGLGDWLTNAGRILGLLAGYGVVVLVALMSRLPPLERGIGTDRLARWHAMGGRYVVSIIVAHALLITWGYSVTAHESLTGETSTLLTSYPDVLMATVAGFLFLGIGLVSARAARRRVSYDTWYHLHLYTYLAIALAFSHQFADGASFISSLKARFVWSLLYASVAALLLWYRVISPLRSAARHRFHVIALRRESADVVSVYIGGQHLDELQADPGQFFRWRFLTRGMWWSSHPYSLSAAPRPDVMRITVQGPRRPQRGDQPAAPGHPDHRGRPLRGVHPAPGPPPDPAAGRRRGHHAAAGHVRGLARRDHPHLPGQQPRGRRLRPRAGRHRAGPRGRRALPDRLPGPARRGPADRRAAAVPRARAARP